MTEIQTRPDAAQLLASPPDDAHIMEAGGIRNWLIGSQLGLVGAVKQWVATKDTDRLRLLCDGRTGLHEVLNMATVPGQSQVPAGAPFKVDESPTVHAARALGAMGLALTAELDDAIEQLEVAHRWLEHSRLSTRLAASADGMSLRSGPFGERLSALLESGLDQTMLIWLMDLAGGLPATVGGPRIQILLDRGTEGQVATLSLSVLRWGRSCLVPDPRTMLLSSADEVFRASAATAWAIAAQRVQGTVLWSIEDFDGPVPRIENDSASGAITVLLDEQRRRQRRLLGRLDPRRLRGRTAIVGRVAAGQPAAISSVGGYEAKLSAVDDDLRVVLPLADREAAAEANRKYGHAELVPVRTWRDAGAESRRVDRKKLSIRLAFVLTLVLVGTSVLLAVSESSRGGDRRIAVAADLAAQALGLLETDPQLSAKLALASYRLDRGNTRAVDAMRSVLSDNQNVERSWQASPGYLTSTAVVGGKDRVVTQGDDGRLKLWKLSTGSLLGDLQVDASQLVSAHTLGVVAAVVSDADSPDYQVGLFDVRGTKPVSMGLLPKPSCRPVGSSVVSLKFNAKDTRVVATWSNGLIVAYDFLTREETDCFQLTDLIDDVNEAALDSAARDVTDADLVTSEASSPVDEVVLLVSSGDVVSVKLTGHVVKKELASENFTGTATMIAAGPQSLSVATSGGVLIWDRVKGTRLSFPAAGLAVAPNHIELQHGNLLIAGNSGTVVLPTTRDESWLMGPAFLVPHGGPATVGSISDRDIVVGGPGGKLVLLRQADTGRLNSRPSLATTALDFRPDGLMVVADTFTGAGVRSSGVDVVDPRRIPMSSANVPTTDQYNANSFYINAVAGNRQYVAAAGQTGKGGAVVVWPTDHSALKEFLLPPADDTQLRSELRIIVDVGFVDDLGLLVARHISGEVGIWSTSNWERHTIQLRAGNPRMELGRSKAVFPEGSGAGIEVAQVELRTSKVLRRVGVPELLDIDGTDDSSRYVTVTGSGVLRVFDGELNQVGEEWQTPSGTSGVSDLSLSPDGRLVAVAQGPRVLVFDVATHLLAMPALQVEADHEVDVVHVHWSPEGDLLVGTVGSGVPGGPLKVEPIAVWAMAGLDWPTQVCRWTGGGLSESEWKRYVGDRQSFQKIC